MSLGAIAARLYTIQSKKNIPLSSAFTQIVRENLAVRFSVYSLVKSITKSETLATIAQAKYGRKTPEERAAETEKLSVRQQEVKFRRYVAGSIVSLNRKIDAVSAVTRQNTQLIEALYNEIGSYQRQRRVNIRSITQVSTRVPIKPKTLKGKIDKINADLEKIKKMEIGVKKKKAPPPKKEVEKETSGIVSSVLGALLKNPSLALAIAAKSPAIALARYGLPALALANLPNNLGKIAGRLQGEQAFEDPLSEKMSQAITPALAALGTYTGGMLLTNAYNRFRKPSKAAELVGPLPREQMTAGRQPKMMDRLKAADKKYSIPVGKSFTEIKKWNKITSAITTIAKRVPSLTAAYVVYKIAEMSNYVVEKDMGRMKQSEYKTNMINSYADLASTLGPQGLGMLIGGMAGTALFPGIGTATLALFGGALGGAVSLFTDSFDEGSMWLATKMFEIFHEDKPLKKKQREEVVVPTADELQEQRVEKPTVTSQTPDTSLNISDVEAATTDKQFMDEVLRVSNKFEINPEDLLAVMAIETAGTFRPDIKNPNSSATGLIQFTEATAKELGTTTASLALMTRAGQMKYVEKYFDMVGLEKGSSAAEIYAKVFLPGRSDRLILTRRGENFYDLNRGLDVNSDGQIDQFDLTEWTNRKKMQLPGMLAQAGLLKEGTDTATLAATKPVDAGEETRMVSVPPDTLEKQSSEEQTQSVIDSRVESMAALSATGLLNQRFNVIATELVKDRSFNIIDDPTILNNDMDQYRRNSIFGRV